MSLYNYCKPYDHLNEIVIVINENHIIEYCNDKVTNIGYNITELLGKELSILFSSNTIFTKHKEHLKNFTKSGLSDVIEKGREISVKCKSGNLSKFFISVRHFIQNNRHYFSSILTHIRNDHTINSAIHVYNLINNNTDIIVVKMDILTTKILDITNSVENILGFSKDEMLGIEGLSLVYPDDVEKIVMTIEQLKIDKNINIKVIFRNKHKNGDYVWLETNGIGIEDNIVIFSERNITDEILRESELINEQKKIEIDRLQSSNEIEKTNARRELLYYIFHEARGWMNTVTLGIDTVSKLNKNKEIDNILTDIQIANNNVTKIFNDTLTLEKLESGEFIYEKAPFSFDRLINLSIEGIKYLLIPNNIKLVNKCSHPELYSHYLIGDIFRLCQCIRNYLINAIKFSEPNSEIILYSNIISIDDVSVTIKISVRDFGKGINDIEKELIFNKFKQIRSGANQEAGGSGLGLSIVKKIIESGHNGKVGFESSLGKGSIFYFIITCLLTTEKNISPKSNILINFDKFSINTKIEFYRDILLVEDVSITRKMLAKFLMNQSFSVDEAENGQIALSKIQNGNKYKLIIMDKEMPVLDGFEATQKIRELGYKLPIVGLTGNVFKDQEEEFIQHGVDYVLFKPLDINNFNGIKELYLH
jgi:PAS domain S-box-containing protein